MKAFLQFIDRFLRKEVSPIWVVILSGLFSFALFGLLLLKYRIVKPDLLLHIQGSIDLMKGQVIGHPVFFFLLQVFSGFSTDKDTLILSSAFVFSVSQLFKILFSLRFVELVFGIKTSALLFILVLVAQVVIGNSFIQEHYIMGTISPNYFHNGTLLLSMPFVLLFLIENYKYYIDNQRKHIYRMIFFGIWIIFIKPSFLFCWIPVMPFVWFLKYRTNRNIIGILQVAIFLVVLIIFQSQLIKSGNSSFKIVFHPFSFFGTYFNHLAVVVSSLFFSFIVFLFYSKSFLKYDVLVVFLFFILQGLIISFFFFDSFNGYISPNMTWQSSIMAYLMCLVCVGLIIKESKSIFSIPFLLCLAALMVQLVCGIRYIQMSIANKSFFI